jgi:hypothetical protein
VLGRRTPQPVGRFSVGDPTSGYYNDLRAAALPDVDPQAALERLSVLSGDRDRANPVTIAQVGLAACQRGPEWLEVTRSSVAWVTAELGAGGELAYRFPMTRTFRISAPWLSAMAQGQAASLLVRAAATTRNDSLLEAARLSARPLIDEGSPLVVETEQGPVLQEYPTDSPSHVLNGWFFALWGLYDVGVTGDEPAMRAFREGVSALVQRIDHYDVIGGWSRYDLYPHPIVHVSSPFYHQLHIAQLEATAKLADEPTLAAKAVAWQRGAASGPARALTFARKVAFRAVKRPGERSE